VTKYFNTFAGNPHIINNKKKLVWSCCPAKSKLGLEIGPNTNPLFRKRDGFKVEHIETRSTEQLTKLLVSQGRDPSLVEPINYVLDRSVSLFENVGRNKFHWVVSSHVVEHIPDFIGHLHEVASVLHNNGQYVLLIPDRYLTFDCMRAPTTLGDLVEACLNKHEKSSIRHVIDNLRYAALPRNMKVGGWSIADTEPTVELKHKHWRGEVRDLIQAKGKDLSDNIYDHQWVFDPVSFSNLMADCVEIGLLKSMQLKKVVPTYNMDFLAVFEKVSTAKAQPIKELHETIKSTYRPTEYQTCIDSLEIERFN